VKLSKLKKISGKDCVKILCNKYGFEIIRQKGSHVILKKTISEGQIGTVVPLHKELKNPTLRSILRLAMIDEENFAQFQ